MEEVIVSGSLTWVNPYKDGARPPPEVEEAGRRTTPCASTVMHVRLAKALEDTPPFDLDSAPLTEISTDERGNFELKLAPGNYEIFRKEKFGRPKWHDEYQTAGVTQRMIPGGCMDVTKNAKWRRKPDCVLVVQEGHGNAKDVVLHWVNGMEQGVPLPC